jgi:hypothetical protein
LSSSIDGVHVGRHRLFGFVFYSLVVYLIMSSAYAQTYVLKTVSQHRAKDHYQLMLQYPYIADNASFNRQVYAFLQAQETRFVRNGRLWMEHLRIHTMGGPALSEGIHENSLKIEPQVLLDQNNMISVKFISTTYYMGEAHPDTRLFTLNYDLASHQRLTLADIFRAKVHFLLFLSDFARQQLTSRYIVAKIPDKSLARLNSIREGTRPVQENFQQWNLSARGLLISFQPYQVLPRFFGAPSILIPCDSMRGILSKRSWIKTLCFQAGVS